MPPSDTIACSKCGYELLGLPTKGECPECGQRYNMAIREGTTDPKYAARDKFDWFMRRARTLVLIALALLVMMCGGVLQWIVTAGRAYWGRASGVAMVVAVVILLAALASYLTEKD